MANSSGGSNDPDPKRPRLDKYEFALAETNVTSSYAEAICLSKATQWKEAGRNEAQSHAQNRTWDLLRRYGAKDVNGYLLIELIKSSREARLVALGTRGVDYFLTYSPVACLNPIT